MASGDDVAILVLETGPPIPFIVANGTAIAKGDILKNTDNMNAELSGGTDDVVAGIAAEDKIANDGRTSLGVYREGFFTVLAGGAITLGESLRTFGAGVNEVDTAGNASLGGKTLGIALETANDATRFMMELCPGKASVQVLA